MISFNFKRNDHTENGREVFTITVIENVGNDEVFLYESPSYENVRQAYRDARKWLGRKLGG